MPFMRHAVAILLSASACVGAEDQDEADTAPGDDVRAGIPASLAMPEEPQEDICELLPAEGACSLLCDYEALIEQYVPPHTCVAFRCMLTNGELVSAHACHPAD